jgi:poly(A) polymerase
MPDSSAASRKGFDGFLRRVDTDALKVVRRLLGAGHEAYLVGGCVRDIYLGKQPKDFDVATSATPDAIRRLFRNSRIIGRRFKLAHVFFGPKIIETSTFRSAPREAEEGEDLLIRTDNEWGSVEDDAMRRDFTVNGLFFDVEARNVVDFVDGMGDLDEGLIRTIGAPEVRFREDPVRMVRAVKFAARLDFDFERETWKALLAVADDIAKCSRARLLEEVYKLLRGGHARRSFELLTETRLLEGILPSYVKLYGDSTSEARDALHDAMIEAEDDLPEGEEPTPARLLWRYLDALDMTIQGTGHVPVNGVMLAVLFAPLLVTDESLQSRQQLDRRIDELMSPVGSALGIARRDREMARQILMATRRMLSSSGRRRSNLTDRDYFHDALIFLGISVQATGDGRNELSRWKRMAVAQKEAATEAPPNRRRRRRGGRKRRRSRGNGDNRRPRPSDG